MRAVVYTESRDSSVLELVEREAADPGPGEVRVRIVRAGVNPTDWKFRAGGMGELAFPEIVPGQDGAGCGRRRRARRRRARGRRPGLDDAGAAPAPRRHRAGATSCSRSAT